MKSNNNFNPLEWAKQENAPQKSTVNNPNPAAAHGDWAPTDDYAQAQEVVERIVQAGANIGEDYNDYLKVNFAFANAFGEAGRELAEKVCGMSAKFEKKEFDKKYDNCLRSSHNAITIATFYQMAKDAGIDIRTTRQKTASYAVHADTHIHMENNGKDNSLNINNNLIQENSMDTCGAACAADEEENILFQSTFSDKLDEADLCSFLHTVFQTMDTPEGRDKMLLATINLLSGVTPKYYGYYSDKVVFPSLYFIYYGPAGSLKGEIATARHLLTPLKREIQGEYAMEMETYEKEHALWEAQSGKKERAERGPEPKKPEFRTPLIPGDSSASKVIRILKANGELGGVIFETEASVVNDTLGTEYGKQLINILLKSAHHEPIIITRVADDIYYEIEEPDLGAGFTCTPGLLPKLFPSFENGLGSRFLFYGLNRKIGWVSPFKKTEKPLDDIYKELGKQFLELHHELMKRNGRGIQFIMTDDQQQKFDTYFSALLLEQFGMLGEGIESFIYRLGLQAFRILMMLTLLRRYSDWDRSRPLFDVHEQAIVSSEKDFQIMMTMVDTLVNHTAKIYTSLNKDDMHTKFNHHVQLSEAERRLYEALPDEYDTEIIKQTVKALGMNQRTAERYIGNFLKYRIAERLGIGHYRKINVKK